MPRSDTERADSCDISMKIQGDEDNSFPKTQETQIIEQTESKPSNLPNVEDYLDSAQQALRAVDDIVSKRYLEHLHKMSVLDPLKLNENDVRLYKVDLMAYEKDEYATDIQIAELNALAANLSVIQWKKMLGFYADISHEVCSVYTINCNDIDHYEEKET